MTDLPYAASEAEELDPLAFVPVALDRARHDGWTPRRQHDFIMALSEMGTVLRAARAVGMTKQSAYKLRERPGAESFAAAWDCALQMGYDRMFGLAMDRALNGIVTPRFYKGQQIGTRHRFDYRLALSAINTPPPPPPRGKTAR
ncbi:hypothetical protein MZO42_04340 [Sphingomonas psychrotolerans]|uniref:XRE family transcriptional regulator n=1 Tax=Sphingomonas psychrotolerans TaxID=1327635 RepID=A0ABU3N039_9SPHN|nr:hypothetical protein [Sphingomonas psychrotolerans]MDT8757917.1 hypothetical protein [Sphingomonas psychrotolerans]